jgi:hypothetical protein
MIFRQTSVSTVIKATPDPYVLPLLDQPIVTVNVCAPESCCARTSEEISRGMRSQSISVLRRSASTQIAAARPTGAVVLDVTLSRVPGRRYGSLRVALELGAEIRDYLFVEFIANRHFEFMLVQCSDLQGVRWRATRLGKSARRRKHVIGAGTHARD